uniref:Cyclase n=1 Tax=Cacopsylla melanoneura TaxID=428564 RepID=A0A8D8M2D4_9HEMI
MKSSSVNVFIFGFLLSFLSTQSHAVLAYYYYIEHPIDLSHPIDENTIFSDSSESVSVNTIAKDKIYTQYIIYQEQCLAEHGSTHVDAPKHFNKNGWTLSDIPLDFLMTEGVHIDLSAEVNNNENFILLPHHFINWERQHGSLPKPCILLINFGWSWRYKQRVLYTNEKDGIRYFPGLSKEAALWLVSTGKVVGIGVDTMSIDPGNSTSFDAHKILSEHNIYSIESINYPNAKSKYQRKFDARFEHIATLPPRGFNLYVLPTNFLGGTGAPARVVATSTLHTCNSAPSLSYMVNIILMVCIGFQKIIKIVL